MTKNSVFLLLVCGLTLLNSCVPRATAVDLAAEGKTAYTIVCSEYATAAETHAARELSHYLQEITGAPFTVQTDSTAVEGPKIVVGPCLTSRRILGPAAVNRLGQEEFIIRTAGDDLLLVGGRPRGTLYAVYHFLDNILGVRWWAPDATFVPEEPKLSVDSLNIKLKPAFAHRSILYKSALIPDWAARNRINGPVLPDHSSGELADQPPCRGGACLVFPRGTPGWHTFDFYVPGQLIDEHPEWFSLVDGKRVSGQYNGQLCLTNPELLDYMVAQVRRDLRRRPRATIVSISQNDNHAYCRCSNCTAVDKEEGSPAGSILRFVNAAAERLEAEFPDVMIHTFAYTYGRTPPRITKPRHNVLVQLCSAEVNFAHPFASPANKPFMDDLSGWAAISDKLHVWDYIANFGMVQRPHPNLRALGPNLRSMAANNVRYVLEQGIWQSYTEFQELRSWMLSRLLWDPNRNDRALLEEFVTGYYGDAAPYVIEYIDLIHDSMEGTTYNLGMGDQGSAPFLTAEIMSEAESLFIEAEAAVAGETEILARVKRAHLPVQQMWLIHYEGWFKEPVPLDKLLTVFEKEAKVAGASHVSDGLRMETFIGSLRASIAGGATTTASSHWGMQQAYMAFDGLPKTFWLAPGFGPEWITRDLGKPVRLKGLRTSFLEEARFVSTRYTIETSLDGQTWSVIVAEKDVAGGKAEDTFDAPVEARYVRTTILSNTSISGPEWLGMGEQSFDLAKE